MSTQKLKTNIIDEQSTLLSDLGIEYSNTLSEKNLKDYWKDNFKESKEKIVSLDVLTKYLEIVGNKSGFSFKKNSTTESTFKKFMKEFTFNELKRNLLIQKSEINKQRLLQISKGNKDLKSTNQLKTKKRSSTMTAPNLLNVTPIKEEKKHEIEKEKEMANQILKWMGNESPIVEPPTTTKTKNNSLRSNQQNTQQHKNIKSNIFKREVQLGLKENELLEELKKLEFAIDETLSLSQKVIDDPELHNMETIKSFKNILQK
eukprot:TRINITY_DN8023_c0_g1_i1.p1 TRINITY_DN8023_c0_g1~~TRINITY_DN8023_c0_g1_i1.p1  ORF type:complete len:260 (-),score=112.19 TRINITY_DN8023_c0_g1_i1:83-862(-)